MSQFTPTTPDQAEPYDSEDFDSIDTSHLDEALNELGVNVPSIPTFHATFKSRLDAITRVGRYYSCFQAEDCDTNPGLSILGSPNLETPLSHARLATIMSDGLMNCGEGCASTEANNTAARYYSVNDSLIEIRNPHWKSTLATVMTKVCSDLGIADRDSIETRLIGLSMQSIGGAPVVFQDTALPSRTLGTMMIVLPCQHEGGDISLSLDSDKHHFSTAADSEWSITCLAWYSNAAHEFAPLTSGYRAILVYNLIASIPEQTLFFPSLDNHVESIKQSLKQWEQTENPAFLVYPLKHEYSEDNITMDQLRGTDLTRVQCLASLREEFQLRIGLSALQIELEGRDKASFSIRESESKDNIYELDGEEFFAWHGPKRLARIWTLAGGLITSDVDLDWRRHLLGGLTFDRPPDYAEYTILTKDETFMEHRFNRLALVIVPRKAEPGLLYRTTCGYSKQWKVELLLSEALGRFNANPTDPDQRHYCKRLCIAALESHHCGQWWLYRVIFDFCIGAGQESFALAAMRRFLGPAPPGVRGRNWGPLVGGMNWDQLLEDCRQLHNTEHLEAYLQTFINECNGCNGFSYVFGICMELNRPDLAARAVSHVLAPTVGPGMYLPPGVPLALPWTTMQVLDWLADYAAKYPYPYLRPCYDALFGDSRDRSACQRAIDDAIKAQSRTTAHAMRQKIAEIDHLQLYLSELE